jgi:hypothetical protein
MACSLQFRQSPAAITPRYPLQQQCFASRATVKHAVPDFHEQSIDPGFGVGNVAPQFVGHRVVGQTALAGTASTDAISRREAPTVSATVIGSALTVSRAVFGAGFHGVFRFLPSFLKQTLPGGAAFPATPH